MIDFLMLTTMLDNIRPVLIYLEPTIEELAKLPLRERRVGLKNRRKLHTYIADDRRGAINDRRKPKK